MKWSFLFSFLIYSNFCACYSEENFAAVAIKEYAENNFVKNGKTFDIFYNSKNLSLIDDTIKLLGGLAYRVTQVDPAANVTFRFNNSVILIFDKLESFQSLDRNLIRLESDTKKRHLLIVCPKLRSSELEIVRSSPVKEYPINQYLIEEEGQISLKELTRFTPQACHQQQVIEINRFSNKN